MERRHIKRKLQVLNIVINLITCLFIIAGVVRHWNG